MGVQKNNRSTIFTLPRENRQARLRAVFAGRPAERHGRQRSGAVYRIYCLVIAAWPIPRTARQSSNLARAARQDCARAGAHGIGAVRSAEPGKSKAIWILCTNPAVSAPDIDLIEKALRQAELVVVQDAYHPIATSQFAHAILPAAQWSEKEEVMTNSERRITYMPKLAEPADEALADWKIISLFAAAVGYGEHFTYQSAEEIFTEFAVLTKSTLCDYSAVKYQCLSRQQSNDQRARPAVAPTGAQGVCRART